MFFKLDGRALPRDLARFNVKYLQTAEKPSTSSEPPARGSDAWAQVQDQPFARADRIRGTQAVELFGAPGVTRTRNPQIRSLVLCPIELRALFRIADYKFQIPNNSKSGMPQGKMAEREGFEPSVPF